MKKERIIGLIGILIIVLMGSGCISPDNEDMGDIETKTYNQNGISFDYPSTWSIDGRYNSPNQVVTLGKKDHPYALLMGYVYENMPYSQEQLKTAAHRDANTNNIRILSEYYTDIDGERGYYTHAINNDGDDIVGIIYVKNNNFYALRFATENYDIVKPEIDTIINSFHAY